MNLPSSDDYELKRPEQVVAKGAIVAHTSW